MLSTKLKRAKLGLQKTKDNFEEVSNTVEEWRRKKWAKQEADALVVGGDALSVYDVQVESGVFFLE